MSEIPVTVAASGTGNLPAPLTTFIGRRRDIAEIRRLLRAARLLTLTGPGGIGKTRLALEAATAADNAFPDGVWLVDLAPVLDPKAVVGATAAALGVGDVGSGSVVEKLAAHLSRRHALIVLDNCEHVVDASAELAQVLLSAAPQLRILATSRRMLRIVGEYVFDVPALSLNEAVDLLAARAAAVRPGFRLSDTNRNEAARLCAALDGLPLAIELAASRLRTLTIGQLTDRLEDRFALLSGGNRAARPRHRTLRALIEWSYELCSPAERILWNRLAVFVGGFSLEAVESVCPGEGIARPDVLDLLDALIAQSVVLTVERGDVVRYRMLETIREYGMRRLAESGEEPVLRRRHRAYFLTLAQRTADGWYGPGQEAALARLRTEHDNFLAALKRGDTGAGAGAGAEAAAQDPDRAQPMAAGPGDARTALALAEALRFHWCAGGALGDGRRWLGRLLATSPEPTRTRANALVAAAWVALLQGDLAAADRWLDEAGTLSDRLGDQRARALVMGFRGMSALFRGSPEPAVALCAQAVDRLDALNETRATVFWLFLLAVAKAQLGDPGAAQTAEQAVTVAEAHGERLCRAYALWALGFDAWIRGDNAAAVQSTRAGLEIQQGFNDPMGSAMLVGLLAWIVGSYGDHRTAARLQGATRSLWRVLGTSIGAFGPRMSRFQARFEKETVAALGPTAFEKAIAEGGQYDSPARAVELALVASADARRSASAASCPLTRREMEVAALVAEGLSNRQIASALDLSPRTVDRHIEHILAKLGFRSRARVAAWWVANHHPPGTLP
ncbi:LuxR C-terminal-related transcriptional regulator [Streptomyces sp. 11x1]|uniref:ATP-binding protein n=1 Tax=Streptomyces sp. 11x1 TaxID=3038642 RepID=UPI00292D51E3|nr:LuxR C-terminal-related transcriptional regulator [Streptomyces sp. 11x1]WNZ10840.1 LuxR C-terminal-related transcriptional regulator [Streptomyces sp. 11x1]